MKGTTTMIASRITRAIALAVTGWMIGLGDSAQAANYLVDLNYAGVDGAPVGRLCRHLQIDCCCSEQHQPGPSAKWGFSHESQSNLLRSRDLQHGQRHRSDSRQLAQQHRSAWD